MPGYTFDQIQSSYLRLAEQYRARQLTWEQFVAQVGQLQVQDAQRVWWTIDPRSGGWLYHDGRQWMPGKPPILPSGQPPVSSRSEAPPRGKRAAPARSARPAQAAPPARRQSGPGGWRARVIATPILALAPAAACGGLWFLYTFLGTLKGEGLAGVDTVTPAIIIGVPFLLWAFRRPVDSLLRPLDSFIRPIPMPLRYGIVLATPILLGCACASLSGSGYGSLRLSSLISILAAAVLTRKPRVQS